MDFETVADFRKRLKEALDFAWAHNEDDNVDIRVHRGKETFLLYAVQERSNGAMADIPPAEEVIKANTCKDGHILQAGRDRCLTPGCKYSMYTK